MMFCIADLISRELKNNCNGRTHSKKIHVNSYNNTMETK